MKKACVFVKRAKDPADEKIEDLERQIESLKDRLDGQESLQVPDTDGNSAREISSIEQSLTTNSSQLSSNSHISESVPSSITAVVEAPGSGSLGYAIPSRSEGVRYPRSQSSLANSTTYDDKSRNNKRARLDLLTRKPIDFISRGLITLEQAQSYFGTFFQGCDRFAPIFDPEYDTFDSIYSRSAVLFNTICTIGCRVHHESRNTHVLDSELRKLLDVLIVNSEDHFLETVQALLVTACYSPERSLVLSVATRMAFDLGLPSIYEELPRKLRIDGAHGPEDNELQDSLSMRQARTWLFLLVLEYGFQIDAGKIPLIILKSEERRCRILLHQPFSTVLDLRLFPQMELHSLRVNIYKRLDECTVAEDIELMEMVNDARVDLDIWFKDWERIIKSSPEAGAETPILLRNLQVQRYWVESMTYFKAVQLIGVENVAAMSPTGHSILSTARASLKSHMRTILEEVDEYIAQFKYASDFVWAKCAFSFLLLLKLNWLVPESETSSTLLLQDGNKLLAELKKVGTGPGNSTSRLALQVLSLSIDKYDRALREHQTEMGSMFSWGSDDAQADLQRFVPEEFVFEWDFPGLTLFSSLPPWLNPFPDDFMLGINMYDLNTNI